MSNCHFQGLQRRGAGVQGCIDTGGNLFAHVATSDVRLGRVAFIDIKPSIDKLALPSLLELPAAHDVAGLHVLEVFNLQLPSLNNKLGLSASPLMYS